MEEIHHKGNEECLYCVKNLDEGEHSSPIQNYMPCHIIFDVMMDFTMKDRYVATGLHASKSDESHYAGVVSCESVCVDFTYADLNGIDIMASDIQNSYLTAP